MSYNIIIINPPYINYNKSKTEKKELKSNYYTLFVEKCLEKLSYNGVLSVIAPFNFKENFYENERIEQKLVSKYEINSIFICGEIFNETNAKPVIINLSKKRPYIENKIKIVNLREGKTFITNQFQKGDDENSFVINSEEENVKKLILKSREQLNKWKNLIRNNQTYLNYLYQIEKYNKELKSGDIEISGILGISGNGIFSPNINKYLAVLDGTLQAEKTRKKRAELFLKSNFSKDYSITSISKAIEFLENLSSEELDKIFSQILGDKNSKKRFIVYKIINKDFILNIEDLSDFDLNYGILDKDKYVILTKQFDSEQKWYQENPFYINWSRDLVNNSKKSFNFRNFYLFLRDGVFINSINQNIVAKEKIKSVFLTNLIAYSPIKIPYYYFLCIFNSSFINKKFLSNYPNIIFITQNLIRIIPIVIPDESILNTSKNIFERIKDTIIKFNVGEIADKEYKEAIIALEKENDLFVESIYKNI